MANLSTVDPIYDEVGLSYDSDILSEVQDHDNYVDTVGEYHEVHEMQNGVQPNYVVDSDAEYTSDSNIIPYELYVKDNTVQVNKVVNESLTAELARYNKQVELYEKRARFELTKREQKIDEQMRIIIRDRNVQEELLKKELHSVKMQLNSTINHNKLIKEQVTSLKKDFKQKENKYLKEFLDMKQLKEKKKVAIGYKNPLYLTKANQVQPALYNGYELVKTTHAPAIVHDSEDTLELAETTRMKMIEKSKSTLWVDSKIKITPPDYSKEKYLSTFTPQRHLTPEQIFWSEDVHKHLTHVPKPITALTVKNILIENENLIADCLSIELLYSVMNNVNTVSRFSELHDAYTLEQARCLELEAEIS
ncbi:hypothetical protein Tco_0896016 [Tanacetum coccineum]